MAIGFGKTTTSKDDIIASLRRSYLHDPEYLDYARSNWGTDYPNRIHNAFTEEELFNPSDYSYRGAECFNHSIWNKKGPGYESFRQTDVREILSLGYWSLLVTQDRRGSKSKYFQEWDFSINVWCGNVYAFHPGEARNNILAYHSNAVYEKWRQEVLADLSNFQEILRHYNPLVSMYSATCCRSSERVCKRAGLDVRDGFAYLIHRKDEECKHKTGQFNLLSE